MGKGVKLKCRCRSYTIDVGAENGDLLDKNHQNKQNLVNTPKFVVYIRCCKKVVPGRHWIPYGVLPVYLQRPYQQKFPAGFGKGYKQVQPALWHIEL